MAMTLTLSGGAAGAKVRLIRQARSLENSVVRSGTPLFASLAVKSLAIETLWPPFGSKLPIVRNRVEDVRLLHI